MANLNKLFFRDYFLGSRTPKKALRDGFVLGLDHEGGGKKLFGSLRPKYAGEYSSRSGKNIGDAFKECVNTLSGDDLDLLRLLNRAYQLRRDDEFIELRDKAHKRFSKKECDALKVFDGV